MVRTQIYLTEQEHQDLRTLSSLTGKTQSELIRAAVDQFFAASQLSNRQALLQRARGIWKDRNDLPDFAGMRTEFDRRP